jgi:hypothetical protein
MNIYHTLFWGSGALCVIAQFMILRAVFRPAGDDSVGADVPRSTRGMEILWVVLPVFALGALIWAAWKALV